jgi:hypothetical protein
VGGGRSSNGFSEIEIQYKMKNSNNSQTIPDFDDLDIDTAMQWAGRIRGHYPDIGPKEVFRLAKQEYEQCQGVFRTETA